MKCKTVAERLERYVDRSAGPDACWLWTGAASGENGYGHMFRGESGKRRKALAHRVAYELAHGPIPPGLCVMHRCDNPPCCNPAHLRVGTIADNNRDMAAKGRHFSRTRPELIVRGEKQGQAKLTNAAVAEIRAQAAQGTPRRELVCRYGVSKTLIALVITRGAWAHVS